MSKIYSVWEFIKRHRYAVVIAFFAIVVGFADEDSFWQRRMRLKEIDALKAEMQNYKDMYDHDTRALEELEHSREAVIRIAREKYLMKREGEDVYVLLPAEEVKSDEVKSDEPTEQQEQSQASKTEVHVKSNEGTE